MAKRKVNVQSREGYVVTEFAPLMIRYWFWSDQADAEQFALEMSEQFPGVGYTVRRANVAEIER